MNRDQVRKDTALLTLGSKGFQHKLSATSDQKSQILALGSSNLNALLLPLQDRIQVAQYWRRPTISLMASPIPDTAVGSINAPAAFKRYIRGDLRKTHFTDIIKATQSVLIFELLRDILTGVLRIDNSWLANPCELIGLPGAPPFQPPEGGAVAMLGLKEEPFHLWWRDPQFFTIWKNSFCKFRQQVLEPRLQLGHQVIFYECYFAEEAIGVTEGWPSDPQVVREVNAMLIAMKEEVQRVPGLCTVCVPPQLRITAPTVPWGGPFFTHYLDEGYAFAADQLSHVLYGPNVSTDYAVQSCAKRARDYFEVTLKLASVEDERDKLRDLVVQLQRSGQIV